MVQCVGNIVGHHFLDLELISPHIYRIPLHKPQLHFFLGSQQLGRIHYAPDQLCNIKPFHGHLVIAEFQLVQGQKLLHHIVHLPCFINNHIAVKLSALRVIIDTFLESFRIPLDQSDGSLQFMGHIGEEFLPHFIYLGLFLDIFLQLIVSRFQFRNCPLQFFGHNIQIVSQNSYLIFAWVVILHAEIQICHLLGKFRQAVERFSDPF